MKGQWLHLAASTPHDTLEATDVKALTPDRATARKSQGMVWNAVMFLQVICVCNPSARFVPEGRCSAESKCWPKTALRTLQAEPQLPYWSHTRPPPKKFGHLQIRNPNTMSIYALKSYMPDLNRVIKPVHFRAQATMQQ